MVFITHDWNAFKNYAEFCRFGTYQIRTIQGGLEIRIRTGKLGFIRELMTDPETKQLPEELVKFLDEAKEFCKIQDFVKVEGSITDETFHW